MFVWKHVMFAATMVMVGRVIAKHSTAPVGAASGRNDCGDEFVLFQVPGITQVRRGYGSDTKISNDPEPNCDDAVVDEEGTAAYDVIGMEHSGGASLFKTSFELFAHPSDELEDEGDQPDAVKHASGSTPEASLWGACSDAQKKAKWTPSGELCLQKNIFYIKVPKTGSSTVGGVMRRIAAKHGLYGVEEDLSLESRSSDFFEPVVLPNHAHREVKDTAVEALGLNYPIFYVTWVREPIERALSDYYHNNVSRAGGSDEPEAIIKYLEHVSGDFMMDYIRRSSNESEVESIFRSYDFVGVTERMEESMVVLKHVLSLPSLCDVLFVSAKRNPENVASHVDDKGFTLVPHVPLVHQPKVVQEFAASDDFQRQMLPDTQLHIAANATLDRWIRNIGFDAFNAELSEFKQIRDKAHAQCGGEVSLTGADSKCYWNDNGCAYQCLDHVCSQE